VRSVLHPNGVATWALDLGPRVQVDVTTRAGGGSDGPYRSCNLGSGVGDDPERVRANRDAVAAALGLPALTIARQVHGRDVAVVGPDLAGSGHDPGAPLDPRLDGIDALVTTEPDVGLAILVADCAPVVLVDPQRPALAVVHAGRRGAVLDVLAAAVAALCAATGSGPGDLRAAIGPCIGAAAYEIDGLALDEVHAAFGGAHLAPTVPGRARFDLRSAVVQRLVDAGVPRQHLEVVDATTDAAPDLYSHRAERPCGRFALVAALRGHPEASR
jgi:YfiH family protein